MACRHLFKLIKNQRTFYKNFNNRVTLASIQPSKTLRLCHNIGPKKWAYSKETGFAIGLSLLTWLGFEKDDEEKESELIMTLKRAVLCTQREQYEKAEQMLHLALRLAQQQQNQQGVIYCYDLMANLAFDTFQLDKAEKLFVSVLQLLLGGGLDQNDLKVYSLISFLLN